MPKISPDSPRFVQYFSRWVVPEKIAYAKQQGTFDEANKKCASFAPDLCSYIAAGIAEYRRFNGQLSSDIDDLSNIYVGVASLLASVVKTPAKDGLPMLVLLSVESMSDHLRGKRLAAQMAVDSVQIDGMLL